MIDDLNYNPLAILPVPMIATFTLDLLLHPASSEATSPIQCSSGCLLDSLLTSC